VDLPTSARTDVVFVPAAARYALLWVPVGDESELAAPRLYLLAPDGTAPGDYLELTEVRTTGSVALATNGEQVAVAWTEGMGLASVRLLVVDAARATRVGDVIDVGTPLQIGATSVSVAATDRDWYLAYRSGSFVASAPVAISRVSAAELAETQVIEDAPGDSPSVSVLGSTVGLAWTRDGDEDGLPDESLFTAGQSLADLADSNRFRQLSASGQRYLVAASATGFTLVPTTPGSPLVRVGVDGGEICEEDLPENAYFSLLGLAGAKSGVLASAQLEPGGDSSGVLLVTDDCAVAGRFGVPAGGSTVLPGLSVGAGNDGSIAVWTTSTTMSVARATATWCAPD